MKILYRVNDQNKWEPALLKGLGFYGLSEAAQNYLKHYIVEDRYEEVRDQQGNRLYDNNKLTAYSEWDGAPDEIWPVWRTRLMARDYKRHGIG